MNWFSVPPKLPRKKIGKITIMTKTLEYELASLAVGVMVPMMTQQAVNRKYDASNSNEY